MPSIVIMNAYGRMAHLVSQKIPLEDIEDYFGDELVLTDEQDIRKYFEEWLAIDAFEYKEELIVKLFVSLFEVQLKHIPPNTLLMRIPALRVTAELEKVITKDGKEMIDVKDVEFDDTDIDEWDDDVRRALCDIYTQAFIESIPIVYV